jgi:alpha-mannosidase
MALTRSWVLRITDHLEALKRTFTHEIGEVGLEGFTTSEQLTPRDAATRDFAPMKADALWGEMWEYAWFRTQVTIPPEAEGQCVLLRCMPGCESYVLVNGKHACSLSEVGTMCGKRRDCIELTRAATVGDTYDILMEAYAGHGPRICSVPPLLQGEKPWEEPIPPLRTVGKATIELWHEEPYQLYLDMSVLFDLRNNLDPESLRQAEIDVALRNATTALDMSLPRDEMMKTIVACRAILKPLLECTNGSTMPTYYCFGHGHLDVAWLWPLAETERKMVRTISNTLSLAERYPEYRFLNSQPHLFWMMKQRYPDLYARIKEAVKAGIIIADGGAWVEMDTNISGGEALIRQFIHGKRFFKDEFDAESEVLWLPDVFGYTAALPQIMLGCGINYFSTSKLTWGDHDRDPFPYTEFLWEGIDGSQVATHLHRNYNAPATPAHMIKRWAERPDKEGAPELIYPYGDGDGGGGPNRSHLEFLRRCKDIEGCPKARLASPAEFFADMEKRGRPEQKYVGELYFQLHRAVQTSQAKTKMGNRKSELGLREAEFWGTAARTLMGKTFPIEAADLLWKKVLLNQFHDILPGSSIARVYEEAEADYAHVIAESARIAAESLAALTDDDANAMTVFNSLSWSRSALVELPEGIESTEAQEVEGKCFVEVDVPACGYATVTNSADAAEENSLVARPDLIENAYLRAEFNHRGEMVRLYDKETARDLITDTANVMAMYRDMPTEYDAWNLDVTYKDMPVNLPEPATIEVVAEGPLVAILRVKRTLNDSEMTQEIVLRRDSRRIDFRTTIDWRESRKLLKVRFPFAIHTDCAISEIQFGHIDRPNHNSRPYDADRYEVPQHKWTALMESGRGAALLNDCKYGISAEDNVLALSLLRASVAPDKNADRGMQKFTYSVYTWNGPLIESDLIKEGYDLNIPPMIAQGGADKASLFELDQPNIVIETVKPAEDGSGDIVIRIYEATRNATRCTLTTTLPIKSAVATDMLEQGKEPLDFADGVLHLDFRPFEIKTIRFRP